MQPRVYFTLLLIVSCCSLLSLAKDYEYDPKDYDYSYGDPNIDYDGETPVKEAFTHINGASPSKNIIPQASTSSGASTTYPLCCPQGMVFDHVKCRPPSNGQWMPTLDGASNAAFDYSNGFPRCPRDEEPAGLFQSEVFFHNTTMYLPRYVQLSPVPSDQYCIVRVEDESVDCEKFNTKVYACTTEDATKGPGMWLTVLVSHVVLLLTLVAYFVVSDLRSLQGQYMICMVISLLLFNIFLYPLSAIALQVNQVTCIALRAIKYFFFCGVFLWFNVICFDLWRTLKCRTDISCRKRFFLYSLYTWIVGALLTTVVLVLQIIYSPAVQQQDICEMELPVHVVLQFAQSFTMIANAVMVALAISNLCTYGRGGVALTRESASSSTKQCVKLFIVMIAHSIMASVPDFIPIYFIEYWEFMVLQAVAIFGVFVYRNFVLKFIAKKFFRKCICGCASRTFYNDSVSANGGTTSAMTSLNNGYQDPGTLPEKIGFSSSV